MDKISHLSPEKQIYWRMRGAYEERYHEAGGSIIGLSIAAGADASAVAKNTRLMGFLPTWEHDGIAHKPTAALDRPAGEVLMNTLSGISEDWENHQKPIFDDAGRFSEALDLAQRAVDGKITNTEDFKSFLASSEHTILSVSPERIVMADAQNGHEALRQVSQQILGQQPHILDDMKASRDKEVNELLSALSETDLDNGTMDIFKMSHNTGRHPAEIVGIGVAYDIMTPHTTPHLETFFTASGRSAMAEGSEYPEDTLNNVASDLSKEDLGQFSRISLAAAKKQMSKTTNLKTKSGLMGHALEGADLNWDRKEPFALKLFGVQGSIVESKERSAKTSNKDLDRG